MRVLPAACATLFPLFAIACTPPVNGVDGGPDPDGGAPVDGGVAADGGGDDDGGATDVDAGATDGGAVDAGPTCTGDGPLASLQLASGYALRDFAGLPGSYGGVAVVEEAGDGGTVHRVYGVDAFTGAVVDLGTWPTLDAAPAPVFDATPDDAGTVFVSYFLAAQGDLLAAAYSGGTFDAPTGELLVHDRATSTTSAYDAPGVLNAAFVGDALLVQAPNLEGVGTDTALYALADVDGTPTPRLVGELPDDTLASGFVAATTEGVPLWGAFGARNTLSAFAPAALEAALAGGAPVPASAGVPLDVPDFWYASGWGRGAAVVASESFAPTALIDVPVESAADGGVPVVGAPTTVLDGFGPCATHEYGLLTPIGDDLLVGVRRPEGVQLLRIARE